MAPISCVSTTVQNLEVTVFMNYACKQRICLNGKHCRNSALLVPVWTTHAWQTKTYFRNLLCLSALRSVCWTPTLFEQDEVAQQSGKREAVSTKKKTFSVQSSFDVHKHVYPLEWISCVILGCWWSRIKLSMPNQTFRAPSPHQDFSGPLRLAVDIP